MGDDTEGSPIAEPRLILASASPRRSALLTERGLVFDVRPSDVDESLVGDPTPEEAARELAERKARASLGLLAGERGWILAADTVVGLPASSAGETAGRGDAWRLLGKPADEAEARGMLEALSGTGHHVVTGVAAARIGPDAEVLVASETTVVTMRVITADEVTGYVASGEWRGKAGGYAIQETADRFVTELSGGGFDNVVGLPVGLALTLLGRLGFRG